MTTPEKINELICPECGSSRFRVRTARSVFIDTNDPQETADDGDLEEDGLGITCEGCDIEIGSDLGVSVTEFWTEATDRLDHEWAIRKVIDRFEHDGMLTTASSIKTYLAVLNARRASSPDNR